MNVDMDSLNVFIRRHQTYLLLGELIGSELLDFRFHGVSIVNKENMNVVQELGNSFC